MRSFIEIVLRMVFIFLGITLIDLLFEMLFERLPFRDWLNNFFELRVYINLIVSVILSLYIQFRQKDSA